MRFLILAHRGDEGARRVGDLLRRRHGPEEVAFATGAALGLAPAFTHRIDKSRGVSSEVCLASGLSFTGEEMGVVLNRLQGAVVPHFHSAKPGDFEYAQAEFYSLLMSWLRGLPCPVINPVTHRGLSGPAKSQSQWLCLAARAGLPVRKAVFTSSARRCRGAGLVAHSVPFEVPLSVARSFSPVPRQSLGRGPAVFLEEVAAGAVSLLVVRGTVVGRHPDGWTEPANRLFRLSGCDLLEMTAAPAARGGAGWIVCDVSPLPKIATPEQCEAVARLLESESQGDRAA